MNGVYVDLFVGCGTRLAVEETEDCECEWEEKREDKMHECTTLTLLMELEVVEGKVGTG